METATVTNNLWNKSKLLIKGLMIGGLILLLLIPTYYVQNLVSEREARQREVSTEISGKWGARQKITGPVLVVPFVALANDKGQQKLLKQYAYFLPDNLDIESTVTPASKSRGIYQVMLYSADIKIKGRFDPLPLARLNIDPATVVWSEVFVALSLSDPSGLKQDLRMQWNDSALTMNRAILKNGLMDEAFVADAQIGPNNSVSFSSELAFNGSEQLLFTPVGRETTVKMNSSWPNPSFTGAPLPTHRITENGFVATWKSSAQSRYFPSAWTDNSSYDFKSAAFGADLFIAVNDYQKTMRSVKYAILCILLTFAAFFLIETVNKKSVHPFQYGLIGLALVLFYTLLLSISEYTGFNIAYMISAAATILLIAWFVRGLLRSFKLSSLLSVILVMLYAYVFTTLQLEDYSLLLGSIGLFLTLAVVMHFSKKIQW